MSSDEDLSAPPDDLAFPFRLHRLHAARLREGLSLRTVAHQLGITESEARRQECGTSDLPLSVVRRWAEVLRVPVAHLIEEPDDSLSLPLLQRARMVRLMKTAAAILERAASLRVKRLAQQMVDQLIEIMPEVRKIVPWPKDGPRHTHECGKAFACLVERSMFYEADWQPAPPVPDTTAPRAAAVAGAAAREPAQPRLALGLPAIRSD